jgi:hypothetical protein
MRPLSRRGKVLLKGVVAVGLVYLLVCLAVLAVMYRPPDQFGRIMSRIENPVLFILVPFKQLWFIAREGNLKVGDRAPDFLLRTWEGEGEVALSSFQGSRPVVLVFGSYT